ncbi:MAG: enediyne biosynthesis protein [Actinomycetota bacterium]|nr:enediyne biosynthesis protein [Actinomycetota bacterium]
MAIAADNAHSVTLPPACRPRTVTLRGRPYAVVGPSIRDSRLHLAAVITTLQVLGQTVFHFELSIAQILTSIVTCAVLELGITFVTKQVIAWPASAMLTGNGVAFVLRVPGTRHGDWWSTRGLWIFAATAAVSLLSKYIIRFGGRHIFNPSNFGLVVCFLALGSTRADPLDFWWANPGVGLAAALVVIVAGGLVIAYRTRMFGVVVGFYATFAAAVAVVAASGHCMTARWHVGPICGEHYWSVLVTSPEILVFLFFMITDPRTAPAGRRARVVYGGAVALVAAFLAAPQRTEFGTKVAILGALALVCAVRPLLERRLPADDWERTRTTPRFVPRRRVLAGVGVAVFAVPLLMVAGVHARPSAFTDARSTFSVVRRPDVRVAPSEIPTVTIDSQKAFANRLTKRTANQIAHDVIADHVIVATAIRHGDERLAATAADRTWLARVRAEIRTARRTGRFEVATFRFDRISVAVLKLRASQALPEIDAKVHGTVHRVTYAGPSHRVVAETDEPFERVYVVESLDGHFLIVDERAA